MPGSARQSREHKKWLAARRAQFRLKQQFEYIDFYEDTLMPESEALLSGRVRLEIESSPDAAAASIIKIEVTDEASSESDDDET